MMDAWLRLLLMSALLTGCHALPPRPATPMTISSTPTTLPVPVLAKRTAQDVIYPLIDPLEAYAVRVQLIRRAQYSIDLAYYIWGNDLTGHLMLDELKRAAERGVRVRLLLDDNNSKGLDPLLLARPGLWPGRHIAVPSEGLLADPRRSLGSGSCRDAASAQ